MLAEEVLDIKVTVTEHCVVSSCTLECADRNPLL